MDLILLYFSGNSKINRRGQIRKFQKYCRRSLVQKENLYIHFIRYDNKPQTNYSFQLQRITIHLGFHTILDFYTWPQFYGASSHIVSGEISLHGSGFPDGKTRSAR